MKVVEQNINCGWMQWNWYARYMDRLKFDSLMIINSILDWQLATWSNNGNQMIKDMAKVLNKDITTTQKLNDESYYESCWTKYQSWLNALNQYIGNIDHSKGDSVMIIHQSLIIQQSSIETWFCRNNQLKFNFVAIMQI
jgi:hypothetical protein